MSVIAVVTTCVIDARQRCGRIVQHWVDSAGSQSRIIDPRGVIN